jgi:hypothetical protein
LSQKQYVAGATAKNNGDSASLDSRLAPSFVADAATKTNKSERRIRVLILLLSPKTRLNGADLSNPKFGLILAADF